MAKQIEMIWDYIKGLGIYCEPRPAKKVVHLALESDKLNNAQKKRMARRYDTSKKLDGVYSLVTVIPTGTGLEVRHWGRSGKAQSNCEALNETIRASLWHRVKNPIVLISEVTSEDPLAKLSGYLTPTRVNDSEFRPTHMKDNFHDILTLDEFINGQSEMVYHYRKHSLKRTLSDTGLSIIDEVGFMSFEDAQEAVESYWEEGGEGFILRDIHALWTAGTRNETCIKLKEKLSYDVTVVGMCSGKEGSKYQETLGKLYVLFRAFGDPKGEPIIVPISGMTDLQRDLWWGDASFILGKTVKMDAKSFTEEGNLREPRFKEIRHDKGSDFPCTVYQEANRFTKGKAYHIIHNIKVREHESDFNYKGHRAVL